MIDRTCEKHVISEPEKQLVQTGYRSKVTVMCDFVLTENRQPFIRERHSEMWVGRNMGTEDKKTSLFVFGQSNPGKKRNCRGNKTRYARDLRSLSVRKCVTVFLTSFLLPWFQQSWVSKHSLKSYFYQNCGEWMILSLSILENESSKKIESTLFQTAAEPPRNYAKKK